MQVASKKWCSLKKKRLSKCLTEYDGWGEGFKESRKVQMFVIIQVFNYFFSVVIEMVIKYNFVAVTVTVFKYFFGAVIETVIKY